jgi:hypothetical protein
MLPVRIVFYWFVPGRFTVGRIVLLLNIYIFSGRTLLNKESPDRNPGSLKIQYPMKNRYTNGIRGSQIVSG